MHTPTPQVLQACTSVGIDPDTLINWRTSPVGIVLINRLGQKFTVPTQTSDVLEGGEVFPEGTSEVFAKPSKRPRRRARSES